MTALQFTQQKINLAQQNIDKLEAQRTKGKLSLAFQKKLDQAKKNLVQLKAQFLNLKEKKDGQPVLLSADGGSSQASRARANRMREMVSAPTLFELTTPENLERADALQRQYDREDQIIRKGLNGHLEVAKRIFPDTSGEKY